MPRVGLLWRREWDPVDDPSMCRLRGVFAAFAAEGAAALPVIYTEDEAERVHAQLLELDGVLVWVNPIEDGRARTDLDALLRDVADAGVFVSAHPDVILRLGTKQVLADTQTMSWGLPTRVFRSTDELRAGLRGLAAPVVLKQYRGMGGQGVWKVERTADDELEVVHAAAGALPERLSVDELADRCAVYFDGDGRLVQQPWQPRVAEGMTRVYCSHDTVVGFAHQFPRGLLPASVDPESLPREKRFDAAGAPEFAELRERMELEWLPQLQRLLELDAASLPVIWDADFLRADDGRHVLCEINCSSTFAFPEQAMPAVARAALARVRA